MSDRMIKVFIACGWIAAGLACAGNLLVATRTGGLNLPNLFVTVMLFGIAYGIYQHSRAAALAMLIIFAAMRVRFYGLAESLAPSHGGSAFMTSFWVSTLIFTAAYVLAVIGTFAWHARQSAKASVEDLGVGTLEQASASPSLEDFSGGIPWRRVLGFKDDDPITLAVATERYHEHMKRVHPDLTGDHGLQAAQLNDAIAQARKELTPQ